MLDGNVEAMSDDGNGEASDACSSLGNVSDDVGERCMKQRGAQRGRLASRRKAPAGAACMPLQSITESLRQHVEGWRDRYHVKRKIERHSSAVEAQAKRARDALAAVSGVWKLSKFRAGHRLHTDGAPIRRRQPEWPHNNQWTLAGTLKLAFASGLLFSSACDCRTEMDHSGGPGIPGSRPYRAF